jgi:2-oxoglutarate dehydrogenase E2 component (dihydrolipoamide succinyltransferase)
MTTAVDVRAPAEQTEGTRSQVLRWLKNVGEAVSENEPLIEIETDKVTVEVASPGSGVLREILKGEQEEISPGEVLGRIEAPMAAEAQVGDGQRAAAIGAPPDGLPDTGDVEGMRAGRVGAASNGAGTLAGSVGLAQGT